LVNPLNAELSPICHLLALLGAHYILHVSRIRVKADTGITIVKFILYILELWMETWLAELHILKDVYLFCARWWIKYIYIYILKLLGRPCRDWKCSVLNTKSKQTVRITLQWAMVMNGSFLAEYYSIESSIKLCTVHKLLVCV
jgi:hypothetical protein